MMNDARVQSTQSGFVLVLAMLLLLVLTIIGVAALNNTVMQERMAGNTRAQTMVFEGASEGVSRGLDFFYEHIGNISTDNEYDLRCGYVHREPTYDDTGDTSDHPNYMAWVWPGPGYEDFEVVSEDGADIRIEQQMYCCRNWIDVEIEDDDGNLMQTELENPSKLFVLSRATLVGGGEEETSLARREIEIRLKEAEPSDPTCAICAPGSVGNVQAPDSNKFRVHGSCGPAITTETAEGASSFNEAIGDARIGNYDGGIVNGDMGSPWNDPLRVAEFVFWAKLGLPKHRPWGEYYEGNQTFGPGAEFGTADNPEITFVDGSASMDGNSSGAGILIVRDSLDWDGTPDYDGLVVVLGGLLDIDGGGSGTPEGSFVSMALTQPADFSGDPRDLLGSEVLEYPLATSDGDDDVLMANGRPVLTGYEDVIGGVEAELQYVSGSAADGSLEFSDGVDTSTTYTFDADNNLVVEFPAYDLIVEHDDANPARDKFGRLIPDFIEFDNWPPVEYGYKPNQWGWDYDQWATDDTTIPFEFETNGSDFIWSGGGSQAFTYDCRVLQQYRHRLLCETKDAGADPDLPADYDYENGDPSVCQHNLPNEQYYYDSASYDPPIDNQHAWHLWNPSCDCMGVDGETEMAISSWRENLGWREDDFAGCPITP